MTFKKLDIYKIKKYSSFLNKIITVMGGFIFTSLIFYLSSLDDEISFFDVNIVGILFALFVLLLILTIWSLRIERVSSRYPIKENNSAEELEIEYMILNIQIHIVNILTFGIIAIALGFLFIVIAFKFETMWFMFIIYPSISFLAIIFFIIIIGICFYFMRKKKEKIELNKDISL